MANWLTDSQKIGVGLSSFGLMFMVIGLFLLDTALLAIGNLLFVLGIFFVLGLQGSYNFFFQERRLRGTLCFVGGLLLVLLKWVLIGMAVEIFGFLNLFGDFFPVAIGFLRKMPVIGPLLSLPGIAPIVDRLSGAKLPV